MNNLGHIAVEEVALEGDYGCTLPRLFELLGARSADLKTGKLDDAMKEYMWTFISRLPSLQFLIMKTKKKAVEDGEEEQSVPPRTKSEMAALTVAQIKDDYGNSFRVVASEDKRRLACIGVHDPSMTLSESQYNVLATIAKYRSAGMSQADLAKVCDYDSRSIFHYIKCLGQMNFIVKIPLVSKGCNTHLCIHKRFANENKAYQSYAKISSSQPTNGTFTTSKKTTPAVGDVALLSYDAPKIKVMDDSGLKELVVENATGVSFHSGLVKQKICALLEKAKNNVLVAEDIINAFRGNESRFTRRWFNRLFAQLEAKGFTERVHIARGGFSATTEDQGEEDGSRRFFRCVRLLKPYDATLAGPTDLKNPASKTYAAKMAEEDTDVGVIVGEGKVLCEMTLEWQIFRLICLSGSSGVIAQTLKRSLNNIGTKILGRAIDRIMKADSSSKSLGITRVHESVGRERRYRYFASKKALAQMSSSLKPNLKSVAAVAPVHLLQVIPKPAPSSNQSVELPTPAPSSVSVSIENSPEKSAKAAQKRIIPVSVGNLQRRNHILELLEEEKVLEMGMGLVKSYEALLEKQGIKTAFRVDKKTVVRTCNSLASDGLASVHVVQVPLLNGNYATRSFLLHKSLAADDTFVREFIQNVSERNLLYYPNIQKTKRLYEDGIEIDRVTAKKTRPTSQQEHLDEPAVCEERNSSSVLADNLISSVVPLESVQFLDIPRDTVASTYGYIRTRIVRARLFHEWLFSIMKGENDGAPYKNMGVFTTSTIFMDMPLELFLKIVGIRQITAEMKEFLDDPKNRELPISKLPSGTKFLALRKNSRLKQKLHEILDILMYLHAVLPVEAPEMAEQANRSDRYSIRLTPSYQMVSRVPFYDLVLDVQTLIRFFDVTSKNTLDEFWLSIHSVLSSKPAGEKAHLVSEDVESEEDGIIEPHRSARNVPLHLSLAENWLHQPTFTPEQIRQLDSYVNRISGTTPLAYPQECAIIARELDIPVSRVQIYFKAIEDTVKRKELIKQQRARAKRLNRAILDAGSSVKLRGIRPAAATTPKKDKNERRGRPKRTIERPGRKTISGQMNQAAAEFVERSGEQLPVVVNVAAFNDVFTKVAARRRGNWTSEERENLVLAHAIVTYFRDPVNRIYMAPLSRVINDRPIRSVAKHIETFMKDPVQVKRHDRFIAIWREIHGEGLAEKAYNSDTNIQTMELSKMLEYLKTKAASDRFSSFHVPLPDDSSAITNYRFKDDASSSAFSWSARQIGLRVMSRFGSSRATMSALLSFPFTTQSYENVKLEPMDVSTLKKAVTKATVKNILLTPESSYDPRQAHMMLHKVPLSIVGVSVKELVSEGLIAKARGGKDRRVPGRQFQLSDKSLATLTGCLADRLIPQSVAFSAHLAEQWDAEGKCDVSPLISSGGMACLLDQAASGILKLKAEELPEESPEFSKKAYCVPVSLVPCPEVMHAKESSKRHVTKSNEPSKKRSRDDSIENQPQTVEKEMSAIEKRALERIRESGLLGIAIQDLTNELENCGSSLQEVQERLATLSNRTDQDGHPLISAVGFTEYRYVSHEHAPEWSVKLVSKLQELSDLPHNPVCPARLWFDINGTSVPSVIRACMEALISHIHMRPGIREYILWQQVKTLLSPVEVSDLLDMMVARGAIRVQKVEKSKPLKSALAFFSPDSEKKGTENCYWTLPGWYRKTQIE